MVAWAKSMAKHMLIGWMLIFFRFIQVTGFILRLSLNIVNRCVTLVNYVKQQRLRLGYFVKVEKVFPGFDQRVTPGTRTRRKHFV